MDLDQEQEFNFRKIDLYNDSNTELFATFISSKHNKKCRNSVLYLHGYIDYFFHPHVAEEFLKNDFDFYALDFRRYGRSLLAHQKPNYCTNIEEYFEEITAALKMIKENNINIYILGHSTGGLVGSCYMNRGQEKDYVSGLILNSPFLEIAQPHWKTKLLYRFIKPLSIIFPNGSIEGGLSPTYAKSIHKNYKGTWDFNLDWKPIAGFPLYFKWFIAIVDAQRSLKKSNIAVPVLILHSDKSLKTKKYIAQANMSDTVLDIEDMKQIGPKLAKNVKIIEIKDAVHDIFLSPKSIRVKAFKEMFSWLKSNS